MREVAVAEIAERVEYGVTAPAETEPVGPKMLRITDIQDGAVDWSVVPWCSASSKGIDKCRLSVGDIVFARTGATTGKSFLIRECPEDSVFASYLIRLRLRDEADPSYISHFFRSPGYWRQITTVSEGAAQPGVNASKLKNLRVPLPSIEEQRRIAAVLDAADALQARRSQSLAKLDALTQAIFIDMFGDPFTNPCGLQQVRLGDLAVKFSDGPFGSNLKSEHYVSEGVRVVRLQNIGVGEFLDDDVAFISEEHFGSLRKHECLPGDVLVGTMGDPNLRACIQPGWLNVALNKADCVQIRVDESKATNEWIAALLNCPATEVKAKSLVKGQTRARISMGRLRELDVPVPPVQEQHEFGRRVRKVREERSKASKSWEELDFLFTSLQQRAFRGEL